MVNKTEQILEDDEYEMTTERAMELSRAGNRGGALGGMNTFWQEYQKMFGGMMEDMIKKQDKHKDRRNLDRSDVSVSFGLRSGHIIKIKKSMPDNLIRSFIDSTMEEFGLLAEAYQGAATKPGPKVEIVPLDERPNPLFWQCQNCGLLNGVAQGMNSKSQLDPPQEWEGHHCPNCKIAMNLLKFTEIFK